MEIEDVTIEYLPIEDQAVFIYVHKDENVYSGRGEIVGYYSRKNLRVAFYYKPSWFSRMKMYWLYGWTWEDKE